MSIVLSNSFLSIQYYTDVYKRQVYNYDLCHLASKLCLYSECHLSIHGTLPSTKSNVICLLKMKTKICFVEIVFVSCIYYRELYRLTGHLSPIIQSPLSHNSSIIPLLSIATYTVSLGNLVCFFQWESN